MSKTIDLQDLPEEEVNLVKDFVSFLKGRLKVKQAPFEEELNFSTLAVESFSKDWENNQDAVYDNWKELYHVSQG